MEGDDNGGIVVTTVRAARSMSMKLTSGRVKSTLNRKQKVDKKTDEATFKSVQQDVEDDENGGNVSVSTWHAACSKSDNSTSSRVKSTLNRKQKVDKKKDEATFKSVEKDGAVPVPV